MKKLIFLFLTLLIVGCATTRKTVFFERVTPQPLSVIDSLNTVHGLSVPTNLDSWGKDVLHRERLRDDHCVCPY